MMSIMRIWALAFLFVNVVADSPIIPHLGDFLMQGAPVKDNVAPSLSRCRRPLCTKICELGNKLDLNGCPICECLEDPCADVQCFEKCVVRPCNAYPCLKLDFACRAPVQCLLRKCRPCKHGMKVDDNGCETCECKKDKCDGAFCPEGYSCDPSQLVCKGNKCIQTFPTCIKNTEKPEKVPKVKMCPLTACLIHCPFGKKMDANGCELCACEEACSHCKSHEKCELSGDLCDGGECNPHTICTIKSACRMQQDEAVTFKPSCLTGGDFKPVQCYNGQCWCVDDRGKPIDGTSVREAEGEPSCVHNKTSKLHAHFLLRHTFVTIDKRVEVIKKVLGEKIIEWTHIEKEQISEILVEKHEENIVMIKVTIIQITSHHDLGTTAFHLRRLIDSEPKFDLNGNHFLIPQKYSANIHHEFSPDYIPTCRIFLNKIRQGDPWTLIVYIVLPTILMMLLLLGCCIVLKQKLRQRLHFRRSGSFHQNLLSQQELGPGYLIKDDEKPSKQQPIVEVLPNFEQILA